MPDVFILQFEKLEQAAQLLLAPSSYFSIPAVAASFLFATVFLLLRHWRRRGRMRLIVVLKALVMSRGIIGHRSTAADVFYYLVNTFAIGGLIGWGMFSATWVAGLVVNGLTMAFGHQAPIAAPDWALRAGITMVAFIGYELGYYIDHVMKHKIPVLWAFHKTHHSAEVLTPLTVYRVHPVDSLIFIDVVAVVAGSLYGLFTYAAGRDAGIYMFAHSNVIFLVCLFLLAQLQHSQFWIPLRGLAGRIVLSPAHHQLHHSADPAHYDCNLGSFLAIWDWMFGTLHVPAKNSPRLRFGVNQSNQEPHRMSTLMIDPVINALRLVRIRDRRQR